MFCFLSVNVQKIRNIYVLQSKFFSSLTVLQQSNRCLVPQKPSVSKLHPNKIYPKTTIDAQTIALLERLSLVNCANKESIETLERAIEFADQILEVNSDNIEPLVTVLEDRPLLLREDVQIQENTKEDLLSNAAAVEEDYFIAPPGNIPLEDREDLLCEKVVNKSQ